MTVLVRPQIATSCASTPVGDMAQAMRLGDDFVGWTSLVLGTTAGGNDFGVMGGSDKEQTADDGN